MRHQVLLVPLFLLSTMSAFAFDKIEYAIINGADEAEFLAALQGANNEYLWNWSNSAGETYFNLMARYDRADQVHWMMEALPGAQRLFLMGDKWVKTAIERAVECGSVEAFKALYTYWDSRILFKGGFTRYWQAGFTLYHVAAYFNKAGIIDSLHALGGVRHEEGGGLNVRNDAGETPLDVAKRRGAKEAIAALERLGAVPSAALPPLPQWHRLSPIFVLPQTDEAEELARADATALAPVPDVVETVTRFAGTVMSGLKSLF